MQEIKAPLTNLQVEYLKLISLNLREEELKEIRAMIIKFLNNKLQKEINKVWEEKGYNEETIQKWLNED